MKTEFKNIENQKFFKDGNDILCKFGKYGMGIGINGTIAKEFKDADMVVPHNPFKETIKD